MWKADATPRPQRVPYLATVFQRVGWSQVAIASGAIVHSCPEHGTYVLTAYHAVDEATRPGVWIYAHGRKGAKGDEDELLLFGADIAYPPEEDFGWGPLSEFYDMMRDLEAVLSRDFAILKLRTEDLFETVPIHSRTDKNLPVGTSVRLGAVPPEMFPHLHEFVWSFEYPPEVFQEGHSGGPILLGGALFAIIASTLGDSLIVMQRPTVPEMREHLEKVGLGFLLEPESCKAGNSQTVSFRTRVMPRIGS